MNTDPENEKKLPELPETVRPAVPETPDTATAPAADEKPETASEQPAESAAAPAEETKPARRRINWGGIALDAFLVLGLLGVMGGGAYYLKEQRDRYRVPSLMELAATENLELCKQREALQAAAYHADEQIHMRRMLARLERELGEFSRTIAEKEADVNEAHNKVLALQHEIRRADKEARSVAKSLLPGMPIGNATTTSGKVYRNATIYRMEGKLVTLRCPEGQARFPVNQLVKDNLPTLAKYAFNREDLIDMTDFEASPADAAGSSAPQTRAQKPAAQQAKQPAKQKADYDPEAGAPVVDTAANKNNINNAADTTEDTWQPPTGELPF